MFKSLTMSPTKQVKLVVQWNPTVGVVCAITVEIKFNWNMRRFRRDKKIANLSAERHILNTKTKESESNTSHRRESLDYKLQALTEELHDSKHQNQSSINLKTTWKKHIADNDTYKKILPKSGASWHKIIRERETFPIMFVFRMN